MSGDKSTPASNIIKLSSPRRGVGASTGVIKRTIIDAQTDAQHIIAEAEAEAEALRSSAERTACEARETAYREGFEAALLELNHHLLEAAARRTAVLVEVERDVLRLSVKLALKIVGRELEQNEATVADIVATALRQARQSARVTVRVSPADLLLVEQHPRKFDADGRIPLVDFIADPAVARGGCIIETETGKINAQLNTQLRVLERALLERAAAESH